MEETVADGAVPDSRRRPLALLALAALLALEAVALWATAVWELVEVLTQPAASEASAVALLVLIVIAATWVSAIAVNVLRHRAWVRGAAVTWQIVQVAVGIGLLQGIGANVAVGLALIIPSEVVVALLFTPAGLTATGAREARPPAS
jgi:hypothetical protein